MKQENLLWIIGSLVAAKLFVKPFAKIGMIYPDLSQSISTAVINEIGDTEKYLKEVKLFPNKKVKKQEQELKISSSRDAYNICKNIAESENVKSGSYIFLFVNRRGYLMNYLVRENLGTFKEFANEAILRLSTIVFISRYHDNPPNYNIDTNIVKEWKRKMLNLNIHLYDILFFNNADYVSMADSGKISGYDATRISESKGKKYRGVLTNKKEFADLVRRIIGHRVELNEFFVTIYLTSANRPIAYTIFSIGGTDATTVDTKLIAAACLKIKASKVILFHNHPSGTLKPSNADITITDRIIKAFQDLNIIVVDHIIVTKNSYYSFNEDGRIRDSSIGAIVEDKPRKANWLCKDGTYSTSKGPGACSHHGGIEKEATIVICSNQGGGSDLRVIDLPLDQVSVNHEWFQNRATPYSARSVDNIVNAVDTGNFKWVNFDPITVWRSPKGELFILSGHSRTEGFRRLCESEAKVKGRTFCKIPAKIVEGISLAEARKIATESNTLSTPETDIERAAYFRKLRMDGMSDKDLKETARRTEGRNANTILAFSFLNPTGKAFTALRALESGDATSKNNVANIARWIGNARMRYPMLDNSHENEIYDWLVIHKAYGTSRGQISSEREFSDRLFSIINRRIEFGQFQPGPLNIHKLLSKSPSEQQYDHQVNEAQEKVKRVEKELKEKINDLARRGATKEQIQKLTVGLEAALRNARVELQKLLQDKGRILEQAKKEPTLFGIHL